MALEPGSITRVNPLDLNDSLAIGIVFPLLNDGRFEQSFTIKQQVKSNILNVLLTERGERLNQPEFGVGLKGLLFENNVNTDELTQRISEQLDEYVPDVEILNLTSDFIKDQHLLQIKLEYAVIYSNEKDAIKVNIGGNNDSNTNLNSSEGGF